MAVVMFTWRGLWEKRGWMNITYVKYLATWLAPCRCSEMLGFPPAPFLFLSLWLLHLLFCLTLTNYKPALHRQVNHLETKCSPCHSTCWASVKGYFLHLDWSWSSEDSQSILTAPGSPWGCCGFLGFNLHVHGSFWGKIWRGAWGNEDHWENKTIVTEHIKMFFKKGTLCITTLQKTFSWSLYFSYLSISWAFEKLSKK